MDVSYFTDELATDDFEEAVRLGAEAGATGLEIRSKIWGKRVQEIDEEDVKRVQGILATHGVRVASMGSPFGKCAHDSETEKAEHHRIFERIVELAHVFDTRIVRVFALWNPLRKQEDKVRPNIEEYLDTVVPFLEPAVRLAEREGVVLSLENEGATLAGICAESRAVADALGNPEGLTFCWDVNNGTTCGERAFPEGYEQVKGNVSHLHVKPNEAKGLDPILGTDMVCADLLKVLVADGYAGAVSIEHWGSPELMLKGVREIRAVVDSL